MEQLLSITTIPAKVNYNITSAKLVYDSHPAKMEVTREKGGLKVDSEPVKIEIDQRKMFDSINLKSPSKVARDYKNEGWQESYEAIAKTVKDGNRLLPVNRMTPADIVAAHKAPKQLDMKVSFMPSEKAEIRWQKSEFNMSFTPDKLKFDFDVNPRADLNYIPGDIKFIMEQRPEVVIEYVGSPRYVPPSADPNYAEPMIDRNI